ncbi:MAG: carboxypeptidase-like regulatory domain-containing protein [Bacteroidales bacterium]|nr:carboxypeptidase-like regulatory domain-containing protein [Bacteroidales bacterium]
MNKLKLIYFFLFFMSSSYVFSQENILEKKITIDIIEQDAVVILETISENYGVYFSYDPEIFTNKKSKTISFKNESLKNVLENILEEGIQYKIVNNHIVIYKATGNLNRTQNIRGRIIDKDIKMPLIGATVIVKNSNPFIGAVTDTAGYYELLNVPIGRQSLTVSYVGYKTVSINNLLILSARENILDVELEESVGKIEEVKISAYNRKADAMNEMATVGARSFTIEETEKFAGSWGDPSRMATNYAGVVMAGDERNDIVVRGNSPSALIWQLDGIPIPSPNHFDALGATGGPVSILNNNTLSRSDFFTGAFPAEYGNGYSGVFDLRMRNGNYNKYEFMGQLGFNGFELGAEGPLKLNDKSSFLFNYRYSMLGLVDDFLWIDELPHYQDFNYKINIPYRKGNLSVFGFGGSSYIEFSGPQYLQNSEELIDFIDTDGSRTCFSGIKNTHFISDKFQITNLFAVSFRNPKGESEYVQNEISLGKLCIYEDRQINYNYSVKLSGKINKRNTIKFGMRVERTDISASLYQHNLFIDSVEKVNVKVNKTMSFNENKLFTINGFSDYQHKFSEKLILNTGIHYLHFFLNNTYSIEPRLGLKYKYNSKGEIGLAYGKHCQVQSPFNYFIQDSLLKGTNEYLDFTKSHQYVIGHNYSFNPNLHLKVETYYQWLYDVPVLETPGSHSILNYGYSEDILWADSLVNKGTGENYGVDITFERFLADGYYFLFTTSLFNSSYKGADMIKRNTRYNGKFILNALGGYEHKIGKNSLINYNTRLVYAGGMWINPIDEQASREYGYAIENLGKAYSEQLNNYFRFDIRIGFILQLKKFTHEIAVEITNLTNHGNESGRFHYMQDNEIITTPYYQQGFFPMGLYRINF